ncbi:MAG: hypothetical protein ABIQ18_32400 [Umezawaea sp.]
MSPVAAATSQAITEAQRHFDEWVEMLYGLGVLPLVAEVSNTTTYATELPAHSRRLVDDVVVVDTDASRELTRLTALSRGSFALAGPRGAGKSTLMAQWSASDRRDLTAIVHAPVGYKPEEFLVHLFTRMRDVVAQCGDPALRRRALAERDALRYVRSHTVERERAFDAGLPFAVKLALKGKHALKRDEVPLNHPQRVDRFRLFLGHVADEVGKGGGRVLIGIDELGRISDGDQAQQFLKRAEGRVRSAQLLLPARRRHRVRCRQAQWRPTGLEELTQLAWPSVTVLTRAVLEAARDGQPYDKP